MTNKVFKEQPERDIMAKKEKNLHKDQWLDPDEIELLNQLRKKR